jgi:hypothetical protein
MTTISIIEPTEGSFWKHHSGRVYEVLFLTNKGGREDYPRTVVYKDDNGEQWSGPLSDWYRRMTQVSGPDKKFWVSWYHKDDSGDGPFELGSPWWVSGSYTGGVTIVAAALAPDEDSAKTKILGAYDSADPRLEWRFCDVQADDWVPFTGRFPRAEWMVWP